MPKTFRNLYDQIYDFEHLLAAYRRARRGKRRRPDVAAFEFLLEKRRRLATADADEAPYWQAVSQPTLDTIWANDEDEIYASLPHRA